MISLDRQIEAGRQFSISGEDEIIKSIAHAVAIQKIYETLAQLGDPHREIFMMHSQGITQINIAKMVNRTQGQVSKSIKRTRGKLLLILRNEYLSLI